MGIDTRTPYFDTLTLYFLYINIFTNLVSFRAEVNPFKYKFYI